MDEDIRKLVIVLYLIATIIAIVGLYVFTIDRFIGIGIVLVAVALFIIPMTRARY
ncbi:MAG: hypothetical protein ACE5KV_05915 [Thermoplasmata archaeon]